MANLPLHPRMARMVLWGASRGPESARLACQVAAVLGDRDVLRGRDAPADIRCRLGAMWDANGKGARLVASAPTSSPPPPPPPTSAATPVRVPIGTKVDSGRKKRGKMKGAPRGKKPAGGGVAAAARAARAASTTGGSSANSASPFDAHEGFEIDRAAAREAGKVAEQLLGALGRLARSDADDAWRAPGVGEGDPTGPVFPFLLGEGVDEVGALLAMAYPDRVGVRRSGRGAFQLSGGSGAANVPDSDPLSREAILAVAELSGDVAGGARNDRARLAAPVPASALEPGGCLHEHLCETRDRVAWAVASKAVVARRLLAVGEAVLRETPYAPEPEDTVPAMLEGVRAMGARTALGWSDDTEKWRRRVMWLRRVAEGGGRDASGPRRRRARRDDGRVVSAAPPGRRVGVGAAKTGRRRSAPVHAHVRAATSGGRNRRVPRTSSCRRGRDCPSITTRRVGRRCFARDCRNSSGSRSRRAWGSGGRWRWRYICCRRTTIGPCR